MQEKRNVLHSEQLKLEFLGISPVWAGLHRICSTKLYIPPYHLYREIFLDTLKILSASNKLHLTDLP